MLRAVFACTAAVLGLAWQGVASPSAVAPVPARTASAPAGAASAETPEQSLARSLREQQEILAKVRQDLDATPTTDATYQRKRRLLAAIEKRISEESGRPWRRYISPATQEAVYADYYRGMARRIEDRGTRDFPTSGGQKVYGELSMNITVDATGHVIETEVVHGSGNPLLDRKAVAIARSAAPFGPFSADLRAKADQIVATYHFRFIKQPAGPEATQGTGTESRP